VVTPCFLFLLVVYLSRDKIVAALLACDQLANRAIVALIILSCGMGGQLSPGHRGDFKTMEEAFFSRCLFVASAIVQSLILVGTIAFVYLCYSHPGELDNLLQVVLCLAIVVQVALLKLAFCNAESALSFPLVLRQVFRVRRAPRIAVPSRTLGVLTPPPQSLLLVAA
jgi:hypothetical protein